MLAYASAIKNIHKLCSKKQLTARICDTHWLLRSAVGRSILYRQLCAQDQLHLLDEALVPDDTKRVIIRRVSELARSVGAGQFLIEGNPANMALSQWLALEQALTKALLTKQNYAPTDVADLINTLNNRRSSPSELTSRSTPYLITGACFIGYFIISGLAVITLNTLDIFGYNVSSYAKTSLYNMALLIGFGDAFEPVIDFVENRVTVGIFKDLSDNWDDVFNLKSPADAILMGLLSTSTLNLLTSADVRLPNFLAESPSEVLTFAMAYLNEYEAVRKDDVHKLDAILTPDASKYASELTTRSTSADSECHTVTLSDSDDRTFAVYDIDLSPLMSKAIRSDTVPAPLVDTCPRLPAT